MKRRSLFFVVCYCCFLTSCMTMEGLWKWSQYDNKLESYEYFVKKFPKSSYIPIAQKRIEDLKGDQAFRDAEEKNSITAYKEFIQKYPSNGFAEVANKRINSSDLDAFCLSCQIGTIQAFQGFIESYPLSEFLGIANSRFEFLKAIEPGTLQSYKEFVNKYPLNLFIPEAETTFPSLWLSIEKKKVGVEIKINDYISWRGIFKGGRITEEKLRQKVFDNFKKEAENKGIDVLLLNTFADTLSKNIQVILTMNYSEGKGESYAYHSSTPAGPGLNNYAAQQLNDAAVSNLSNALAGILTGPNINVINTMTLKDTITGQDYYSNFYDLDRKVDRISVVKVLGIIKDKNAIPSLLVAMNDKDVNVQSTAVESLKEITGQDFGKNLAKWQNWWKTNKYAKKIIW